MAQNLRRYPFSRVCMVKGPGRGRPKAWPPNRRPATLSAECRPRQGGHRGASPLAAARSWWPPTGTLPQPLECARLLGEGPHTDVAAGPTRAGPPAPAPKRARATSPRRPCAAGACARAPATARRRGAAPRRGAQGAFERDPHGSASTEAWRARCVSLCNRGRERQGGDTLLGGSDVCSARSRRHDGTFSRRPPRPDFQNVRPAPALHFFSDCAWRCPHKQRPPRSVPSVQHALRRKQVSFTTASTLTTPHP